MSAHILCTGVLSAGPERVTPSGSKKRPLYRGAMVIQMDSGAWLPASFSTWSTSCADELAILSKGDAIAAQGRLSIGAFLRDGKPAVRIIIMLEKLIALPKPKRSRPSMSPDDVADEDEERPIAEALDREGLAQLP